MDHPDISLCMIVDCTRAGHDHRALMKVGETSLIEDVERDHPAARLLGPFSKSRVSFLPQLV